MASKLTDDQYHLLSYINSTFVSHARRTDELARNMTKCQIPRTGSRGKPVWDNSHVPFVGLQLRERGLLSTYKDNQSYARWDITAVGKAALLEETHARQPKPAKEAPVTVPKQRKFRVIDLSDGSVSAVFMTQVSAEEEASRMAKLDPGNPDGVMVVEELSRFKTRLVVDKE